MAESEGMEAMAATLFVFVDESDNPGRRVSSVYPS
jgi:hypothetical protein